MPGVMSLKSLWLEHEESEIESQVFPQINQSDEAHTYRYHIPQVLKHVGVLERRLEVLPITPRGFAREASRVDCPIHLHLCPQCTVGTGWQPPSSSYAAFHSASWISLLLAERSHCVEHVRVLLFFSRRRRSYDSLQCYLSAC